MQALLAAESAAEAARVAAAAALAHNPKDKKLKKALAIADIEQACVSIDVYKQRWGSAYPFPEKQYTSAGKAVTMVDGAGFYRKCILAHIAEAVKAKKRRRADGAGGDDEDESDDDDEPEDEVKMRAGFAVSAPAALGATTGQRNESRRRSKRNRNDKGPRDNVIHIDLTTSGGRSGGDGDTT